jgi:hypothetical protein
VAYARTASVIGLDAGAAIAHDLVQVTERLRHLVGVALAPHRREALHLLWLGGRVDGEFRYLDR